MRKGVKNSSHEPSPPFIIFLEFLEDFLDRLVIRVFLEAIYK
jgi:hypothetical protein